MNFRNSRKRCTSQAENFTAADLQGSFRSFRKRYANQGRKRNAGPRRKSARGFRSFRSFRKRYANYGAVDVSAQRQAASAVWLTSPRRVLDRAVFADSGSSAGHGDAP